MSLERLLPLRYCASLTLTLALLVFPAAGFGQALFEPGRVVVTPSAGIAFDPDADVSLAVGGAAAYPLAAGVVVEGELAHLFDLTPADRDVDSSLTTIHAALLYVFETEYLARPYVAGGLGVGRFSHEVTTPPASIRSTEVGFNLGAGVMYPLRDAVVFRGDFRYFKHIDDVPSAWRVMGGIVLTIRN